MTRTRRILWVGLGVVAVPLALASLWIALNGWNWLRSPIEAKVLKSTGRALDIRGDLSVQFGWPYPRLSGQSITFANPSWAAQKNMVTADAVEISIDVPALWDRRLVLPTVHLIRPVVYLERGAAGRKNWLLDQTQQNEDARVQIGQLTLDSGTLGYDDPAVGTHIRADISSQSNAADHALTVEAPGVAFRATGTYQHLPLLASGNGGSVLALRDERVPYPLTLDATIGHTHVKASGTVTRLIQPTAVDMQIALSGESLDELYPLLGIPAPASRAYTTHGHLLHSAKLWRYERFTGRVGSSDLAGLVQVTTGGQRPELVANLDSDALDLDDMGMVLGKRAPGTTPSAKTLSPASQRMLPDLPFKTDHWSSMNADVWLRAKNTRRAQALALSALAVHLELRDAVLTLDPFDVQVAGGRLHADISLDGRAKPIQAKAHLQLHQMLLSKLLPTVVLNQASIGKINGSLTLAGNGDSVGHMLATANGKLDLVVDHGEISQLMMEKAGLHLWEMLALNMSGDKRIALRCAVADFSVSNGVMEADALIFDTQVTTLLGSGQIDLAHETLDLTLHQRTKKTSPVALRSPILIRGSFMNPRVGVDKTQVAMRAAGATALALVSPLLVLIPLVDPGPGADSDCANLLRDAKDLHKKKTSPSPVPG